MLQVGDASCFVEKATQGFFVELVDAQDFEGQYAAEWRRFAHLVDMAIASRADEGDDLVVADMGSRYEEVAALATYCVIGVLVSPTGSRVQTTCQLFHLVIS